MTPPLLISAAWLAVSYRSAHGFSSSAKPNHAIEYSLTSSQKRLQTKSSGSAHHRLLSYDKTSLQMNQDDEEYDVENNVDQYSSKQAVEDQPGNYLEALAISVTLFFLATTWLSDGQLFSSSNYDSRPGGKASFYKHVDAESVLQEDFNRASSSVIF
jgi:hypothetical protein